MDKFQCSSNLLEIKDDSITMQELSNSIDEIGNTPDIYLIFQPPAIHGLFNKTNIEYAASNRDIIHEIVNNKIEFMSIKNSSDESPITLDKNESMIQEFSDTKKSKYTILQNVLTDTHLKVNKHKDALRSSKHTTIEGMQNEISIKSTFKIQKRCNTNYSNLIKMYCTKCNKVSINYIDTKCEDCKTLLIFQCITCDSLYQRLISIQNHIKYECYKNTVFYCNECNFETIYKMQLIKHIQNEHSQIIVPNNVFMCSTCQKKFRNKQSMLSHERACSSEHILKCKFCPFKTKFIYIIKKHVQSKHQKFQKKNYECPDCGKKYEYLKNLNGHMRKFCSRKLKLKCDHCNYTSDRKYALAKHIHQNHSEFIFRNKFFCSR